MAGRGLRYGDIDLTGKAFTREVSPRLAECELTHRKREPIDAAIAALQHEAYEGALRSAGLEVCRLPSLPDHPDGVFVEDTALLLDNHAIILRPGAASRASEVRSTAAGLAGGFEIWALDSGHVDGGDVLRIGMTLYVGLSTRTNAEGIAELATLARRLGFDVVGATLRDCLHLKTAATLAGRDQAGGLVLLYDEAAVDPGQFAGINAIAVDNAERDAANVVSAGGRLIMPAGRPRTASMLRDRGFRVIEVDVSELQKAEAGVTCMSLIS